MRGQSCETPTRTPLRRELGYRDTVIHQLRNQLNDLQNQANQALQNQQSHFALVHQRYEDEVRASQDAQTRQSALNDHLEAEMMSRVQTLVKQEEDSQQQALLLQQQMATASDRISASDNLARQYYARLREVEHEASDRQNRLEGELQDAAASASHVQRERNLSNARNQLSFLSTA